MKDLIYYQRPIIAESFEEDGKKKTFIAGNAIDTGISRNKVQYTDELLRSASQTLIGKPLLLNHGDEDVRNIVGKVIQAGFDGKNVPFKAELDTGEENIIRKVENGFINSVSIGAFCPDDKITVDSEGVKHPEEIEFVELSLVPIPGVPNATISQVIHEKFEVKKMEETEKLKKEIQELREEKESLLKKLNEEEETPEKPEEPEEKEEDSEKKDESLQRLNKIEESMKKLAESVTKLNDSKGIVGVPAKEKKDPKLEFIRERNKNGSINFYPKHPEEWY